MRRNSLSSGDYDTKVWFYQKYASRWNELSRLFADMQFSSHTNREEAYITGRKVAQIVSDRKEGFAMIDLLKEINPVKIMPYLDGVADGIAEKEGRQVTAGSPLTVDEAREACSDLALVKNRLTLLHDMGLGYLTLGEETPSLSGGEAQRLKLASEMGRGQEGSVFVFDEPTIGLHPLDVRTLMQVFQRLIDQGATVIVIEHDLDVIRSADYLVDMGPGGGEEGGRIVAAGTPERVAGCDESVTGRYLR